MKFATIVAATCVFLSCQITALADSRNSVGAARINTAKAMPVNAASSVVTSTQAVDGKHLAGDGSYSSNSGSITAISKQITQNISSQTVVSSSGQATPALSASEGHVEAVPKGPTPFGMFYILSDDEDKNHFAPSGWMGDASDLKVSAAYIDDRPDLGKTCMRVTYLARGKKEWAGIFWQHPAGNWGAMNGVFNLNGAKYITFWARGDKGGEKISEFKMGGLTGKYPDSDTAWLGPIKLKKEWAQYKIDLKSKDLRYISGGFCFTVLATDDPSGCTFYLADVKYE